MAAAYLRSGLRALNPLCLGDQRNPLKRGYGSYALIGVIVVHGYRYMTPILGFMWSPGFSGSHPKP